MFLRQFQYLVAVAQEEHFGRAARSCHVSQPSLSSGIKQLELELGVPIFLRGRGQRFHGLTPEGEHVARWARQVISDCSAMRDEIDAMQNNLRGNLRVGSMPSMSPVLPVLVQLVRQRHPGVQVDVQFIGNDAMMQRDRIHPNAEGARTIAENIWPYLKALVGETVLTK